MFGRSQNKIRRPKLSDLIREQSRLVHYREQLLADLTRLECQPYSIEKAEHVRWIHEQTQKLVADQAALDIKWREAADRAVFPQDVWAKKARCL